MVLKKSLQYIIELFFKRIWPILWKVISYTVAFRILLWVVLSIIIYNKKDFMLHKANEYTSKYCYGDVRIGNIKPEIWRSFPGIGFSIKNVEWRDSNFNKHKIPTLHFDEINVRLDILKLIRGKAELSVVEIKDGNINLFVLKDNISNLYLLQSKYKAPKSDDPKKVQPPPYIPKIVFKNVTFKFREGVKNKTIQATLNEMKANVFFKEDKIFVNTQSKIYVDQLTFVAELGGYAMHHNVSGNLHFYFDPKISAIVMPMQKIKLEETELNASLKFLVGGNYPTYHLLFEAPQINIALGRSVLTKSLGDVLKDYNSPEPIKAHVKVDGFLTSPDTAIVRADFELKNNTLYTQWGPLKNLTLKGFYFNHVENGKGNADTNSEVKVQNISGSYYGIKFNSTHAFVNNLTRPILDLDLKTNFDVGNLDSIIGNEFKLSKGKAQVDINYKGELSIDSLSKPGDMNGYFKIKNADLTYIPKGVYIPFINIDLEFKGKDLFIPDITVKSKTTDLHLSGTLLDLMSGFLTSPDKAILNWKLKGQTLDIEDIAKIAAKPAWQKPTVDTDTAYAHLDDFRKNFSQFWNKAQMVIDLNINEVRYRKFHCNNIFSKIILNEYGLDIPNLHFNHSVGFVDVTGHLREDTTMNIFSFAANMSHISLTELTRQFENFGMQKLKPDNLVADFSADMKLSGTFDSAANLLPHSLNGFINFIIKDGKMINFPPLKSVGNSLFKNRNLNNLSFKPIEANITIENGILILPLMKIESSAINFAIMGKYGYHDSTQLYAYIPLRNPVKDDSLKAAGKPVNPWSGMFSLYFVISRDANGKLDVRWDPTQKARVFDNSQPSKTKVKAKRA